MFNNVTRAAAAPEPNQASREYGVETLPSLYHKHTTFQAKASEAGEVKEHVAKSLGKMDNVKLEWDGNTKFRVFGEDSAKCCDVMGEIFVRPSDSTFFVECYRRAGCATLFHKVFSHIRVDCAVASQAKPSSLEAPPLNLSACLISQEEILQHQLENLNLLLARIDKGFVSADDVSALTFAIEKLRETQGAKDILVKASSALLSLPAKMVDEHRVDEVACYPAVKLAVAMANLPVFPESDMVKMAVSLSKSVEHLVNNADAKDLSMASKALLRGLTFVLGEAAQQAGVDSVELQECRTFLNKYADVIRSGSSLESSLESSLQKLKLA